MSAAALKLNEYIILASNLTYTNEQIFYRLKTMFNLDKIPSKNPDSVKAWFYGKLFLAALCEAIVRDTSLSAKKQKSSLLLKRSLWNELSIVLKYVTHAVCSRLSLNKLMQMREQIYDVCKCSKRTRTYALQRLFWV